MDRSSTLRYGGTLAILAVALTWFFLLRPVSLGGTTSYIVVSGISMLPTYEHGDLVLMRERNSYRAGDIVAYKVPEGEQGAGSMVIHRIVGEDDRGYITRGDNRTSDDVWRPATSDVFGEAWLRVPAAGSLLARLRAPLPFAVIAGLFAIYWVMTTDGKRTKKNTEGKTKLGSH